MAEKLESNETGSVIIVVDTVMGSAIVAEDKVASSAFWRRAKGSVTFMKSGKAGSVKLVKSSEVGPVKNCERGTGQYTDSSAWSGTPCKNRNRSTVTTTSSGRIKFDERASVDSQTEWRSPRPTTSRWCRKSWRSQSVAVRPKVRGQKCVADAREERRDGVTARC